MVGSNTLSSRKEKKKKQRRSSSSVGKEDESGRSQWYTGDGLVAQELTPVRPPRDSSRPSSAELELTRRSLDFTPIKRFTMTNGTNRNSIGTESTTSEEDGGPPPLPLKQREADYCNLPDTSLESVPPTAPPTPHRVRNKPVPPEPVESPRPPTPPPKIHLKF